MCLRFWGGILECYRRPSCTTYHDVGDIIEGMSCDNTWWFNVNRIISLLNWLSWRIINCTMWKCRRLVFCVCMNKNKESCSPVDKLLSGFTLCWHEVNENFNCSIQFYTENDQAIAFLGIWKESIDYFNQLYFLITALSRVSVFKS